MNEMCARVSGLIAVLVTVITAAVALSDTPSTSTWPRSQPQQTIYSLMMSIDERLRTLEVTRWETLLASLEERLESLETSVRRLDTTFQERLDKLDRNLNSKELKDELSAEKLSHKVRDSLDSSYDRYNRRLGYAEERIEMSLKTVQMALESSLARVEKQTEDVQAEVLETMSLLEDLKAHSSVTEDKLNLTHKAIQQHIQSVMSPNHEELQRISGSLDQLGSRLTGGSQNDGPATADLVSTIRMEISSEANKFTSKVNNMYNDVWRRLVSMESMVKDASRLGNTTHRQVLEEVRSLALVDRRDFPGDSQENFLEVALDALERKLQRKLLDLGRKLDDRMDTLSATQSLVMDSCFDGGICRGLETRLSQVLERIFDVFSDKIDGFSNRTFELDSLVLEMMELVKTQHSQLIRTVTHNTNMVVTLAKDSSDAGKLLHRTVSQLTEKTEYNFQELHDEVQEISSNAGVKICNDSEKINGDNNDLQKLGDKSVRNNSEVKVLTINVPPDMQRSNISEIKLRINIPQTLNDTTKYDEGIIKITKDSNEVLSDNAKLSTVSTEKNKTIPVDRSIMQIVSMMSPNLTETQMDNLLNYLNNSMSVDHLEAIIQNTEADAENEITQEGGSNELEEMEFLNRTHEEEEINVLETEIAHMFSFGGSDKNDVLYDLTKGDSITNDTGLVTGSIITDNKQDKGNTTRDDDKEMLNGLTEELKMYSLLMLIKNGRLNFTNLQNNLQHNYNQSLENNTESILPVLKRLCYGKESTKQAPIQTNNLMRVRLLSINQTIDDDSFYEKIENICNTMVESLQNFQTKYTSDDQTKYPSED